MTKTNQIPVIADDQAFSASNEYLGNRKVKATFAIRRSEREPRYRKEIELDFSNVTEEQLIQLGMYACKVKVQALLRNMPPDQMLDADTLAKVDVAKDLVEVPKKSGDPISAAVRSLMKTGLDEATARAMLADAQAKATKRKEDGKRGKAAA